MSSNGMLFATWSHNRKATEIVDMQLTVLVMTLKSWHDRHSDKWSNQSYSFHDGYGEPSLPLNVTQIKGFQRLSINHLRHSIVKQMFHLRPRLFIQHPLRLCGGRRRRKSCERGQKLFLLVLDSHEGEGVIVVMMDGSEQRVFSKSWWSWWKENVTNKLC